jgi:2-aminoethylphosphonate transport system permease protein
LSDVIAVAPRAAQLNLGALWVAPPLIVLALLFLYPLALIARAALADDSGALNFAAALDVLNSRAFLNALLNTAEIALASTAGCTALGLTLALILAFAPFPGAGFAHMPAAGARRSASCSSFQAPCRLCPWGSACSSPSANAHSS